jgi:hypothetical protein
VVYLIPKVFEFGALRALLHPFQHVSEEFLEKLYLLSVVNVEKGFGSIIRIKGKLISSVESVL